MLEFVDKVLARFTCAIVVTPVLTLTFLDAFLVYIT